MWVECEIPGREGGARSEGVPTLGERVRTLGERVRPPDHCVLLRDTKKTAHYALVCSAAVKALLSLLTVKPVKV